MAITNVTNNTYGIGADSFINQTAKGMRKNNIGSEKTGSAESGDTGAARLSDDETEFKTVNDLMEYLSQKYKAVEKGITEISKSYLKKCLNDKGMLKELFNTLDNADTLMEKAQDGITGYQGMKIKIDRDGNMTCETWSGTVKFNQEKRSRQLASAKTPEELRTVLSLLSQDLADCKNGVRRGMCDESEVAKVQAMLNRAQQRMGRVSSDKNDDDKNETNSFYLNMLI